MENMRNKIDVKLVNNKKDNLKCTSKPSYMSREVFDNALKLNKRCIHWNVHIRIE